MLAAVGAPPSTRARHAGARAVGAAPRARALMSRANRASRPGCGSPVGPSPSFAPSAARSALRSPPPLPRPVRRLLAAGVLTKANRTVSLGVTAVQRGSSLSHGSERGHKQLLEPRVGIEGWCAWVRGGKGGCGVGLASEDRRKGQRACGPALRKRRAAPASAIGGVPRVGVASLVRHDQRGKDEASLRRRARRVGV